MILQNLLEESNQPRLCVLCDYLMEEDSLVDLQWLSLLLTLVRVGLVRQAIGENELYNEGRE